MSLWVPCPGAVAVVAILFGNFVSELSGVLSPVLWGVAKAEMRCLSQEKVTLFLGLIYQKRESPKCLRTQKEMI